MQPRPLELTTRGSTRVWLQFYWLSTDMRVLYATMRTQASSETSQEYEYYLARISIDLMVPRIIDLETEQFCLFLDARKVSPASYITG